AIDRATVELRVHSSESRVRATLNCQLSTVDCPRYRSARGRSRERRAIAGPAFRLRPEVAQRNLQAAAEVDLLQAAVGHAKLAADLADELDAVAPGRQIGFGEVDGDDQPAVAVAGSPEVIVLVAADRLR